MFMQPPEHRQNVMSRALRQQPRLRPNTSEVFNVNDATCRIDECEDPTGRGSGGLCWKHAYRKRKYGDPLASAPTPAVDLCSVDGCQDSAHARGWCSRHWQRWRRSGELGPAGDLRDPMRVCNAPGCTQSPRTTYSNWCEMHNARVRRLGTLDLPERRDRIVAENGYVLVLSPDHPLARPSHGGRVFEHRQVMYDLIGPGTHPCFWCDAPVAWGSTLHVDHVDHDRANNDPMNLVPSCRGCNTTRKESITAERWALITARKIVLRDRADEIDEIKRALLARRDRTEADATSVQAA